MTSVSSDFFSFDGPIDFDDKAALARGESRR